MLKRSECNGRKDKPGRPPGYCGAETSHIMPVEVMITSKEQYRVLPCVTKLSKFGVYKNSQILVDLESMEIMVKTIASKYSM